MNIPPVDPLQGNESDNPPAHEANSTSQGEKSIEVLQRQIAELQRKNNDVISDNQKYRKKQKEQEELAKSTLELKLKEQGEFQKLAEQHQARVQELEPISERYSKLTELVSDQIKSQTKDWPPEIKTFDPGENASIEDRLAWVEKSKPLIDKLQASKPGNGPNPKPSNGSAKEAAQTAFDKLRATGQYSRF